LKPNNHKKTKAVDLAPPWYEDAQPNPILEEVDIEYILEALERQKAEDADNTFNDCGMDPCVCDYSHSE